MDYRILIFLLSLSALPGWPAYADDGADTIYISDMLRVGVRPEPGNRSTPVGVVITGMQLEVLERRNGYLRIRTDKGLTGWIKDVYATEEPPAMIRLERLNEARAGILEEREQLRETVKVLEKTNSDLNNQLDELKAERSKLQLRLARDAFNQSESGSYRVIWLVGLGLAVIAAFAGGVFWQRRQTTRRLGGLRL